MARDYFQRENLIKGFKDIEEEDFVMISDLDEIPNLENLNFSKIKERIIIFKQKMFYYKLNLFYENFIWHGTRACKKISKITSMVKKYKRQKNILFGDLTLFFPKKIFRFIFC